MSTIDDKKNKLSHVEFINRVNLLSKFLKLQNIDTEKVPGINRASKSSYKTKGKLPSFATLEALGKEYHVNLNWLVLGDGEMLRSEEAQHTNDTHKKSEQHETMHQLEQELLATKNELITVQKEALLAKEEALLAKEEALSLYRKLYKAQ